MGLAYYIATETEDAGFDTFVSGKAVAKTFEQLDELAKKLNVAPLSSFVSMSADGLASLLGDEAVEGTVVEEKWFQANEVLASVRSLAAALANSDIANVSDVAEDLVQYARVLERADKAHCRVRLSIDF